MLPTSISGTDALRTVRKKMTLKNIHPAAFREASVRKPELFYVPFWYMKAQVNGYALGVKPKFKEEEISLIHNDPQNTMWVLAPKKKIRVRIGEKAVEKEIHIDTSINITAADLEPLGIPSLSADTQFSITGMEIQSSHLPDGVLVLDRRIQSNEGTFVDPTVTLSEAYAQLEKHSIRLARGSGRSLENRWDYMIISGKRASLVYYPLWITAFIFKGRTYHAVVDGRTAAILRGRFPGKKNDKFLLANLTGVFWAAILPFLANIGIWMNGPEWKVQGRTTGCAGVLILLVIGAGYMTFRFIQVLEETAKKGSDYIV